MATIPKGKHYDTNPFSSLPFICLDEMQREVTFTESCRYYLPRHYQENTNKLFGMAFGFDHQKDSARFGWAYNPETDRIDINAYCYVRGVRRINWITDVPINEPYKFCIQVFRTRYVFTVEEKYSKSVATYTEAHVPTPCYGYTLGLYFGGALPAPQDIEVLM